MNDIDLDAAVRDANRDLAPEEQQMPVRKPSTAHVPFRTVLILVIITLMVVPISSGLLAALQGRGDPLQSLEQTLDAARNVVERTREVTGQYPDVLPNAALGAVVYYHREGDSYLLRFSDAGYTITQSTDGSVKIERD